MRERSFAMLRVQAVRRLALHSANKALTVSAIHSRMTCIVSMKEDRLRKTRR